MSGQAFNQPQSQISTSSIEELILCPLGCPEQYQQTKLTCQCPATSSNHSWELVPDPGTWHMLSEKCSSVKLLSTSSLLEVYLVLFYHLFHCHCCCFVAAQHINLIWIVSSVQTHCLYCRIHSFLVRLTVTDSLNLLSLLLELLSPGLPCGG